MSIFSKILRSLYFIFSLYTVSRREQDRVFIIKMLTKLKKGYWKNTRKFDNPVIFYMKKIIIYARELYKLEEKWNVVLAILLVRAKR